MHPGRQSPEFSRGVVWALGGIGPLTSSSDDAVFRRRVVDEVSMSLKCFRSFYSPEELPATLITSAVPCNETTALERWLLDSVGFDSVACAPEIQSLSLSDAAATIATLASPYDFTLLLRDSCTLSRGLEMYFEPLGAFDMAFVMTAAPAHAPKDPLGLLTLLAEPAAAGPEAPAFSLLPAVSSAFSVRREAAPLLRAWAVELAREQRGAAESSDAQLGAMGRTAHGGRQSALQGEALMAVFRSDARWRFFPLPAHWGFSEDTLYSPLLPPRPVLMQGPTPVGMAQEQRLRAVWRFAQGHFLRSQSRAFYPEVHLCISFILGISVGSFARKWRLRRFITLLREVRVMLVRRGGGAEIR